MRTAKGIDSVKKASNKQMRSNHIRFITMAAVIAALYAVLTMALWEISSAGIQFRLSEALCVLPAFTPAAIPGLALGCAIANIFGGTWIDVVFGSLATLLAAVCTRLIARALGVDASDKLSLAAKLLVPLPPVLLNAAIIPFVLYYGYGLTEAFGVSSRLAVLGLHALTVGAGEAVVCYLIGVPLMIAIHRIHRNGHIF